MLTIIKTHKHLMASLFACVALSLTACSAGAQGMVKKYGVTFAREVNADGVALTLSGVGVLKYRGLIKVYVAALYVDMTAENFDQAAKRLDVKYLVNAKAKRFNDAGERILRADLGEEGYEDIAERFTAFSKLYPDSRKGDRCFVFWKPGSSIELTYNGVRKGDAPGDEFAKNYFDIWLGQAPASAKLRDTLLDQANKQWPGEK